MTEKKTTTKKVTLNPEAIAVVAAILMTKGTPTNAALENAKIIVEAANELAGK